ncbi:MAG: hypothetical protein ACWGQW_00545 [bacterium]
MSALVRRDVVQVWTDSGEELLDDLLCPSCFHTLEEAEGEEGERNHLYCPNMMCLDERVWTLEGEEIDG